ncbi:TIGR02452 family protein [Ruminococcus sp.]|uniref:TIGR02452 family protein n=1 Tax=Ruminococcus sp. TaxID=41978 RepID=UPI002C234866|nr:TIGR02452 family protein [Ruminococcus sp.]HNZ99870.1 TIGR02452 family protein [Ruminococcus sp.]HOH87145.1 TIGR02452 family protein [Ruminococcus sp.]
MNNIAIANETMKITADGFYELGGKKIELPREDTSAVEVWAPEKGAALLESLVIPEGDMCTITVTREDSFTAASRFENAFVMNFANAHKAGGGFRLGANAQEEALCRCSTLYASITSEAAGAMYRYNNTHLSSTESDYMLYSPNVCVFRSCECKLLEKPFMASVITVPAPNRRGAAIFASNKKIAEVMTRRIRIMLAIAAKHGHRSIVLGAWGCGAFGNSSDDVAGYFRKVLIDEKYGRLFDNVCFAIYSSESDKKYSIFSEAFS